MTTLHADAKAYGTKLTIPLSSHAKASIHNSNSITFYSVLRHNAHLNKELRTGKGNSNREKERERERAGGGRVLEDEIQGMTSKKVRGPTGNSTLYGKFIK